jgi:hypothetical protein
MLPYPIAFYSETTVLRVQPKTLHNSYRSNHHATIERSGQHDQGKKPNLLDVPKQLKQTARPVDPGDAPLEKSVDPEDVSSVWRLVSLAPLRLQ